jgi:hypothetical protein
MRTQEVVTDESRSLVEIYKTKTSETRKRLMRQEKKNDVSPSKVDTDRDVDV